MERREITIDNDYHQPKIQPYFMREKKIILKIACGNSHSILLTNEFVVFGWGDNKFKQLCLERYETVYEPMEILEMRGSIDICCGE